MLHFLWPERDVREEGNNVTWSLNSKPWTMVDVPWSTGSGIPMEIDLKPLVFGPGVSNKNVSPKWLESRARTAEIKDFAGISGGMMAPGWERIFEGEQLMMRFSDGEFEDIMIS